MQSKRAFTPCHDFVVSLGVRITVVIPPLFGVFFDVGIFFECYRTFNFGFTIKPANHVEQGILMTKMTKMLPLRNDSPTDKNEDEDEKTKHGPSNDDF